MAANHSRSTNTLQAIKQHRSNSTRRRRKRQAQSRSGPQTPVSSLNRRGEYHQASLKNGDDNHYGAQGKNDQRRPIDFQLESEHERKCVFNKMLKQEEHHHTNGGDEEYGDDEEDLEEDPRKQYVAVQQGHDIPLKGLRKPAPQPNVYKVVPAPPPYELVDGNWMRNKPTSSTTTLQENTYTGQPLQSNGGFNDHYQYEQEQQPQQQAATCKVVEDALQEEVYKDFDSVYELMCSRQPLNGSNLTAAAASGQISSGFNGNTGMTMTHQRWSKDAMFESEALAKSLAEVEEALRRASSANSQHLSASILAFPPPDSPFLTATNTSQVSPTTSSTYGKFITGSTPTPAAQSIQQLMQHQPSPIAPSIVNSEQGTNRADSRNTNQSYQNGPALVEEMTLSDLEDEISSSLMATKESTKRSRLDYFSDGEQMLIRRSRNRNPLPTSLTMRSSNTLNLSSSATGQSPVITAVSGYLSDHLSAVHQQQQHNHHLDLYGNLNGRV